MLLVIIYKEIIRLRSIQSVLKKKRLYLNDQNFARPIFFKPNEFEAKAKIITKGLE